MTDSKRQRLMVVVDLALAVVTVVFVLLIFVVIDRLTRLALR